MVELPVALTNLSLLNGENLTLAGLLLFSDRRQQHIPLFTIQCVKFDGYDITGNTNLISEPAIDGCMYGVFLKAIAFIDRNMGKLQGGPSFNSPLKWEIPLKVLRGYLRMHYFIEITLFNPPLKLLF